MALKRDQQHDCLSAMGIDVWVRRSIDHDVDGLAEVLNEHQDVSSQVTESPGISTNWQALQSQVRDCTACELHQSRTQTVFGTGNKDADWLIIGEAPGADEDRQGEPFVGRAGQLLTEMLRAIGLQREQVYIANILKCRPPDNRDPRPEEIQQCSGYLRSQISLIKPRIILVVGRIAAQSLLKTDTPIGKMRGHRYEFEDSTIPVVVTYHPAYLLRSPQEKKKSWNDLKLALKCYKENR